MFKKERLIILQNHFATFINSQLIYMDVWHEQGLTVSNNQASKWSSSTSGNFLSKRAPTHVAAAQLNADDNHLDTSSHKSFYLQSSEVDSEEDWYTQDWFMCPSVSRFRKLKRLALGDAIGLRSLRYIFSIFSSGRCTLFSCCGARYPNHMDFEGSISNSFFCNMRNMAHWFPLPCLSLLVYRADYNHIFLGFNST